MLSNYALIEMFYVFDTTEVMSYTCYKFDFEKFVFTHGQVGIASTESSFLGATLNKAISCRWKDVVTKELFLQVEYFGDKVDLTDPST